MLLVLGDGSAQAPLRCQDPQSCRVVLLPSEPVQVDDTIIIYQEDRRAGLTRSSIDRGKQQSASAVSLAPLCSLRLTNTSADIVVVINILSAAAVQRFTRSSGRRRMEDSAHNPRISLPLTGGLTRPYFTPWRGHVPLPLSCIL